MDERKRERPNRDGDAKKEQEHVCEHPVNIVANAAGRVHYPDIKIVPDLFQKPHVFTLPQGILLPGVFLSLDTRR